MTAGIRTDTAPAPVGAYPHARRVGNLLFLSGIGPRDAASNGIAGNGYSEDGRVRELGMDVETADGLTAAYGKALAGLLRDREPMR